jgi:hypothetical protein
MLIRIGLRLGDASQKSEGDWERDFGDGVSGMNVDFRPLPTLEFYLI